MILDGIMLMFIGMGVVFIFLVLLNFAISLLARITKEYAEAEYTEMKANEKALRDKKAKNKTTASDTSLIAAITAAVKVKA